MREMNVREIALTLLLRTEESGSFSHLLIDQEIKKGQLNPKDAALLTEVVYGTLQNKIKIDYILSHYITKKRPKLWIQMLLRLSLYQMYYLDRVPDHAILNEAVEIAKRRGDKGIASFINGVLRSVQRSGLPDLKEVSDDAERISIETSHPLWLVKRWIKLYGLENTKNMTKINMKKQPLSIRIQPLKINRDHAISCLQNEGYTVRKSRLSPQGIVIEKGNITKSKLFKNGKCTIQDESSMLVGELAGVEPGMKVLDSCSAPGGKATHLAEKMQDTGTVFAFDLHKNKLRLINKRQKELNLSIIKTGVHDARKLQSKFQKGTFDRIIVDAPCSGLGVIRTKPDIKYNKTYEDIERLSRIQLDILNKVSPLLKEGGKLIYSTCTIDKSENEDVVQQFLKYNLNFKVDDKFTQDLPKELQHSIGLSAYGLQLFPQTYDSDGFFIVRLVKNSD